MVTEVKINKRMDSFQIPLRNLACLINPVFYPWICEGILRLLQFLFLLAFFACVNLLHIYNFLFFFFYGFWNYFLLNQTMRRERTRGKECKTYTSSMLGLVSKIIGFPVRIISSCSSLLLLEDVQFGF